MAHTIHYPHPTHTDVIVISDTESPADDVILIDGFDSGLLLYMHYAIQCEVAILLRGG